MKHLLLFFLPLLFIIISCSDNEPTESNSIGDAFLKAKIIGTWKEVRLVRLDTSNVVIEDANIDSSMIRKLSFSSGRLQYLFIDTTSHFYFLLYFNYSIHNDSLYYNPDSLLSVDGQIHHWISPDSGFVPYFPVLVYPFSSFLGFQDPNKVIETRKFPDQTLEIYWQRLSAIPADLSSELLSISQNDFLKTSNDSKIFRYNYYKILP